MVQISDLISRMQSDWPTLACPSNDGTCSESILDEHNYFETAFNLKKKVIQPGGGFYSLDSINEAISDVTRFTPGIECNVDASGNSQLYQICHCVDKSGSNFIECSVFPTSRCGSKIEFPSF
ncbi:hypothetical protein NE237_031316 [Protea cynaroides]|uniref:Uncharacterized protein n=1 Tax=Protea cynaroides TaxID=273540 RepID=A0A9Q0L1A0_9MAGN|nr:hypothetical protein NE237_031316 [Protea cynaroides]